MTLSWQVGGNQLNILKQSSWSFYTFVYIKTLRVRYQNIGYCFIYEIFN